MVPRTGAARGRRDYIATTWAASTIGFSTSSSLTSNHSSGHPYPAATLSADYQRTDLRERPSQPLAIGLAFLIGGAAAPAAYRVHDGQPRLRTRARRGVPARIAASRTSRRW
jgi:hypothetical protein